MTDPQTLQAVREALEKIEKAEQMVSDLCQRRREWIMSIPASPDHDPDLVIADALRAARQALLTQPADAGALHEPVSLDECAELIAHVYQHSDMQLARRATQRVLAIAGRIYAGNFPAPIAPAEPETVNREIVVDAKAVDLAINKFLDASGISIGGKYNEEKSERWFLAMNVAKDISASAKPFHESVLLDQIRCAGWVVAVHNDYRLNGIAHTFWLFTKDGRAIKGEGMTDKEALTKAVSQIEREQPAPAPSPAPIVSAQGQTDSELNTSYAGEPLETSGGAHSPAPEIYSEPYKRELCAKAYSNRASPAPDEARDKLVSAMQQAWLDATKDAMKTAGFNPVISHRGMQGKRI